MSILLRRTGLLCAMLLAAGGAWGDPGLPPKWDRVLAEAAPLHDPGARAVLISARFLATPYRAHTLVGGPETPEQLTIRFDAVDCFTFLDYVEALRRSTAADEFPKKLIEVRYRDGVIAWDHRRHFFTDWAAAPENLIVDVTMAVGGDLAQQVSKTLNRKADGTRHLPGVALQERTVRFIPGAALDDAVLDRLRPGDYLGIYTPAPGLDVSHVGIVLRKEDGRLLLRHASSPRAAGRVVDSDLRDYLAGKPGIVVLRPR